MANSKQESKQENTKRKKKKKSTGSFFRKIKKSVNMEKNAKAQGTKSQSTNYKRRIWLHRRKTVLRIVVIAAAVALVAFLIWSFIDGRTYRKYKVLSSNNQEDTVSTKYIEMGGKTLRYSSESASIISDSLEAQWTGTYDMQNPEADICKDTAVIADIGSTTMVVVTMDGVAGTITTDYNIVKARVARQGVVAAILDGGDDTWINFYTEKGDLIAENQTRVDDPGYPMDVAVSPDGNVIMVAYQFVEGGETTSYVAFYNFATAGQNEVDNIVSGYTYNGVVVPEVEYLTGSTSVAFRDNGFTVYSGKQIPKEKAIIDVDNEIISTFYDSDRIGLVFKEDGQDKMYKMQVYNINGKLEFEHSFNIQYTNIRMSDDCIVMYNSDQAYVLNERGKTKFDGNIDEGIIRDFFKIGRNRYMLVLDNCVKTIKLA